MTVQLSYDNEPAVAVEGMLADDGPHNFLSGLANTRKLISVAITADNDDDYTITINGTPFLYEADGSATTAEIAAGLVAAINAGSEPVIASGTDTPILIESTLDGPAGDFTYADAVVGSGTLVETVLVAQGQEIPFGKFVCQDDRASDGTSDFGDACDYVVRLPRQSADVTGNRALGVAIADKAREENSGSFRASTMVPVLTKGRCWVEVEEAVTIDSTVHVRYAAGGNGIGSFGDSTGSSERAALAGARYLKGAAANGLALLELSK